jgi:hypothetical protein
MMPSCRFLPPDSQRAPIKFKRLAQRSTLYPKRSTPLSSFAFFPQSKSIPNANSMHAPRDDYRSFGWVQHVDPTVLQGTDGRGIDQQGSNAGSVR